jgi:hypothetical protein
VAHPTYEVAYIVSYKLDRVNLLTTRAISYNLFTKCDEPPSSWFFVTLVVLYPEVNHLSTLGYIYCIYIYIYVVFIFLNNIYYIYFILYVYYIYIF